MNGRDRSRWLWWSEEENEGDNGEGKTVLYVTHLSHGPWPLMYDMTMTTVVFKPDLTKSPVPGLALQGEKVSQELKCAHCSTTIRLKERQTTLNPLSHK